MKVQLVYQKPFKEAARFVHEYLDGMSVEEIATDIENTFGDDLVIPLDLPTSFPLRYWTRDGGVLSVGPIGPRLIWSRPDVQFNTIEPADPGQSCA